MQVWVGVAEEDPDGVTALVREPLGLAVRVSPVVAETDGVTEGDGVPLGVPEDVAVKVGDVEGEALTLAEREGEGVGEGSAEAQPPRGSAVYACILDATCVTMEGAVKQTVPPPLHGRTHGSGQARGFINSDAQQKSQVPK